MAWSPLEIIGVLSGVLGVWLTTRQNVWCWPVGLVSVVAYIGVFAGARLYGAMGLQAIYVVIILYGWRAWLHGGADSGRLLVSRAPRHVMWLLGAGGLAATVLLGAMLGRHTNEAQPYADGFTTSFSLIAQAMQARKQLENWVLWVVVDVIYIAMTVAQGLTFTAGLYGVYVLLAVIGFRDWRRSMAAREMA
jgi:nicotinamide mononucleotide transporter